MLALPDIRLATPADAAGIADMSRDCIEHGLPWSWTAARVLQAIHDPLTNVAVHARRGQLQGFGIMQYGDDDAHLLLLAVSPVARHQGLGRGLTAWLEHTARTAGVFNGEDGTYLPLDGPIRGERLPAFHQLDLRVDKRWVLRRVMMNLYLDVQNIYNHQNPEAVNYSYDWRDRQYTTGLPISPSLGFRFSW